MKDTEPQKSTDADRRVAESADQRSLFWSPSQPLDMRALVGVAALITLLGFVVALLCIAAFVVLSWYL